MEFSPLNPEHSYLLLSPASTAKFPDSFSLPPNALPFFSSEFHQKPLPKSIPNDCVYYHIIVENNVSIELHNVANLFEISCPDGLEEFLGVWLLIRD